MRRLGCAVAVVWSLVAFAGQPPEPGTKARELRVTEGAFKNPQIAVLKSMPPQFHLSLEKEMPTPGWELGVDSLEIDAEAGRIVARLTERAPTGMVAQVVTPTWVRLELGTLDPGRYLIELRVRRSASEKYRAEHVLIVDAR